MMLFREDGGVMPLKPSTAVADSMQCGGRRCEVEVGCAMPLAAGCSVMPLGGDGGVKLPQEDDGAMT
jgi:hypothetical protein